MCFTMSIYVCICVCICVCVRSTHKVKRNARSAPCFMEDDALHLQMSPSSAQGTEGLATSFQPSKYQFTDLLHVRAALCVSVLSLHSWK